MKVGRSLYRALNKMNWVNKGSATLVLPMAMAPKVAMSLKMKSSMETPLLAPNFGVEEAPEEASHLA